jgi:hypothetical protein
VGTVRRDPATLAFTDQADTVTSADGNVSLCLYAHLQNGREVGTVIRYMRDGSESATETDVLLYPPPPHPN